MVLCSAGPNVFVGTYASNRRPTKFCFKPANGKPPKPHRRVYALLQQVNCDAVWPCVLACWKWSHGLMVWHSQVRSTTVVSPSRRLLEEIDYQVNILIKQHRCALYPCLLACMHVKACATGQHCQEYDSTVQHLHNIFMHTSDSPHQ